MCRRALIRFRSVRQLVRPLPISSWRWLSLVPNDIELTTPRGLLSAEITAGDMKRIDLLVRNNGSAELKDVQLTASKPVDWEVTFEPSKIEKLTAGGTTNVTATIKHPERPFRAIM